MNNILKKTIISVASLTVLGSAVIAPTISPLPNISTGIVASAATGVYKSSYNSLTAAEKQTADKIFNFAKNELNLNTAGACAVVGFIAYESHFQHNATNPYSGAYGLCQWLYYTRKNGLINQLNANPYSDPVDIQLKYMESELRTSAFAFSYDALKDASNSRAGVRSAHMSLYYNFGLGKTVKSGTYVNLTDEGHLADCYVYWDHYSNSDTGTDTGANPEPTPTAKYYRVYDSSNKQLAAYSYNQTGYNYALSYCNSNSSASYIKTDTGVLVYSKTTTTTTTPEPTPAAKYYRVYNSSGKQLAAYSYNQTGYTYAVAYCKNNSSASYIKTDTGVLVYSK